MLMKQCVNAAINLNGNMNMTITPFRSFFYFI